MANYIPPFSPIKLVWKQLGQQLWHIAVLLHLEGQLQQLWVDLPEKRINSCVTLFFTKLPFPPRLEGMPHTTDIQPTMYPYILIFICPDIVIIVKQSHDLATLAVPFNLHQFVSECNYVKVHAQLCLYDCIYLACFCKIIQIVIYHLDLPKATCLNVTMDQLQ